MKTKYPLFASVVTLALSAHCLFCAQNFDWPQYLGPNRNSTSAEKGILRAWPEKGPEVLWTATVGRGYGGPVVKDGKVRGYFRCTGIRPHCMEQIAASGSEFPSSFFTQRKLS